MSDLPDPPFADEDEASIRDRMLTSVDPAFNTDEGDLVYDMLTPAAIELDLAYDAMEIALGEAFITTATGAFLDALALQLTGLTRATVDETDDSYRSRALAVATTVQGSGTAADYKTWALGYTGIGFVTVEPAWSGAGTVRVLAAKDDRTALSGGEETALATYLNDNVTPIGATLTVDSITPVTVDFDVVVVPQAGWTEDALDGNVIDSIAAYVDSLQPGEDVIRAEVVAAIMAAEGVFDITSLDMNGNATGNEVVGATGLAAWGVFSVTV